MANNRMYLYDEKTNEAIMLCKSTGGWYCLNDIEARLNTWLDNRDWGGAMGDKSSIRLITESEHYEILGKAKICRNKKEEL